MTVAVVRGDARCLPLPDASDSAPGRGTYKRGGTTMTIDKIREALADAAAFNGVAEAEGNVSAQQLAQIERPAVPLAFYASITTAARQVVLNAEGTSPRHTRARDGGCRDDCIPCGLTALAGAIGALDAYQARSAAWLTGSEGR